MQTARVYRKALTCDEALEQLRRGAGSEFDPNVVRAFLKIASREEDAAAAAEEQGLTAAA